MLIDLGSVLRDAAVGPIAVEGLVEDEPGANSMRIIESLLTSPVGRDMVANVSVADPDGIERVRQLAWDLATDRLDHIRATACLHLLGDAMATAQSRHGHRELVAQLAGLRAELPALSEVELLRDILRGRAALPSGMRSEVYRLLVHSRPAQRLGLGTETSLTELLRTVDAMDQRWRSVDRSGHLSPSAQASFGIALRSLERLQAEIYCMA